ncbi:hypothetical protein DFH11DRAFT_1727080 [Phellopilus nigrolimitatus]|nr:hypothetical protein DFH11DRAFT_1727080 [Phellopilus nigrolimitatus]
MELGISPIVTSGNLSTSSQVSTALLRLLALIRDISVPCDEHLRIGHLKAFSPKTVNSGRGPEFEYAVIALFHLLFTLNRDLETDMLIVLESPLTSNIVILGQMLASRSPGNLLMRLLGEWKALEDSS